MTDNALAEIGRRLSEIRKQVPGETAFTPLAEAIDRSVSTVDAPMQLAIIGKISSSKSTLVNAILGKQELLPTGQKEVTFNVCWLKYGDPMSDVVIHHKDGSASRRVPRAQLDALATIEAGNMDNISYIEIFDDAEILRQINIIDTPGLDALRKKDSQNTLDFIRHVRPDAVVMLFTQSMHENVLDIVREFNGESQFTPLNAIGVLAKIDALWKQSDWPREKSALEIGQKSVRGLLRRNPLLKKTLFELYPVSALLYQAATTVTQDLIDDISASLTADSEAFRRSMVTVRSFIETDGPGPLTTTRRAELLAALDLYGVELIAKTLVDNPELSVEQFRKILLRQSGAEAFSATLYNHFGLRSQLIKTESIHQHIVGSIRQVRGRVNSSGDISLLNNIEQQVSDIFSGLAQEHREYELLNALYNGELLIDAGDADELATLFGERGTSAPQRLGLAAGSSPDELLSKAAERERYWRRIAALEPDPDERMWMTVAIGSYSRLRLKIQEMKYAMQLAKSFLYNE